MYENCTLIPSLVIFASERTGQQSMASSHSRGWAQKWGRNVPDGDNQN